MARLTESWGIVKKHLRNFPTLSRHPVTKRGTKTTQKTAALIRKYVRKSQRNYASYWTWYLSKFFRERSFWDKNIQTDNMLNWYGQIWTQHQPIQSGGMDRSRFFPHTKIGGSGVHPPPPPYWKCATHTCKKREIAEIYLRNFFWIFRKILGWEREINTAPKPSSEVAPS